MKITDLFRQDTVQRPRNPEAERYRRGAEEKEPSSVNSGGEDTVNISQMSRQLNQLSQILSDDEKERAARVAEIKQQVETGSYSVSSRDVASSIISYAKDLKAESELE